MLNIPMEAVLDSIWGLSGLLEKIALIAMLAGVFLVAWAIVKCFSKQDAELSDICLSKVWRTPWAIFGLALLGLGIALDVLAICVRLSAPGRF
jgi:hypothetical protein